MNAIVRALTEGAMVQTQGFTFFMTRQTLFIIFLLFLVMSSALSIVYVRDLNRRLFIDIQTLQNNRDALHTEWGKLLLEQSTWATQARVQGIAQQQLEMDVPTPHAIVMVRE